MSSQRPTSWVSPWSLPESATSGTERLRSKDTLFETSGQKDCAATGFLDFGQGKSPKTAHSGPERTIWRVESSLMTGAYLLGCLSSHLALACRRSWPPRPECL